MSDRVTNADIEDVLSSIRRLVSIDDRRADSTRAGNAVERDKTALLLTPKAKADATPPASDERLVLSPSLKVGPAEAPSGAEPAGSSPAAPDASVRSDGPVSEKRPPSSDRPEVLGLAEWQVDATGQQTEPSEQKTRGQDPSDAAVAEEPLEDRLERARRERQIALAERQTDPSKPVAKKPQTKTLEGASTGSKELEARIAEVEAAVAARDDQWEPDGSEPDADAPPPISSIPWLRTGDRADTTETEPTAPDQNETAQSPAPVSPVPAQSEGRTVSQPSPADQGDGEGQWYAEDTVLDEAALRDLVSEIVRQELQGSLGERITRNVRKLVRREIHRAMMGHDFE
ncbi:MAG: hypothetical protein AAF678_07405 [Pseudomonadota bacterium]